MTKLTRSQLKEHIRRLLREQDMIEATIVEGGEEDEEDEEDDYEWVTSRMAEPDLPVEILTGLTKLREAQDLMVEVREILRNIDVRQGGHHTVLGDVATQVNHGWNWTKMAFDTLRKYLSR
jgi:hypothetical protein